MRIKELKRECDGSRVLFIIPCFRTKKPHGVRRVPQPNNGLPGQLNKADRSRLFKARRFAARNLRFPLELKGADFGSVIPPEAGCWIASSDCANTENLRCKGSGEGMCERQVMMSIVAARHLRSRSVLANVPHDKPGYYRWWASPLALKILLGDYLCDLNPSLTQGREALSGLFCIYVGVAIKESIRARLNWHVNQAHTLGNIKSKALSTLRQTISSLAGDSQGDQETTNRVIDMLTVEYFAVDMPIKSQDAKNFIELWERREMDGHVLPLNIRDNHNSAVINFKKYLTSARKAARAKYLRDIYCPPFPPRLGNDAQTK